MKAGNSPVYGGYVTARACSCVEIKMLMRWAMHEVVCRATSYTTQNAGGRLPHANDREPFCSGASEHASSLSEVHPLKTKVPPSVTTFVFLSNSLFQDSGQWNHRGSVLCTPTSTKVIDPVCSLHSPEGANTSRTRGSHFLELVTWMELDFPKSKVTP